MISDLRISRQAPVFTPYSPDHHTVGQPRGTTALLGLGARLVREASRRGRFEDLRGRLFSMPICSKTRLTDRDTQLEHEFIDVSEIGLALKQMGDVLTEAGTPIADQEHGTCWP